MRPAHLAFPTIAALALFFGAFFGPTGRARADVQGAELSNNLVFECQAGATVRVYLQWATLNAGLQWVDLSLFDNDFGPGSFISTGPLLPYQSSLAWDGLYGGAFHFVRVNTLTPGGWIASRTMIFFTPNDCPVVPLVTTPAASAPCLNSQPVASIGVAGCVSTPRGDYASYGVGETVYYCYDVTGPTNVRIVAFKPDGSQLVVVDGFDNGTGGCIGPYQANVPYGLRTVQLLGGPYLQQLAQTHFYVR